MLEKIICCKPKKVGDAMETDAEFAERRAKEVKKKEVENGLYGTVNMFLKLLYRQAKVLTVENDEREIIDTQNFPAKCLAWKSPNQWRAEVAVAKQALGLSEHDLLPQKNQQA